MGSYAEEPPFKTIKVKEVHPTFAAEVEGVNWKNLSDEQFNEIFGAMAKVSYDTHHTQNLGSVQRLLNLTFNPTSMI